MSETVSSLSTPPDIHLGVETYSSLGMNDLWRKEVAEKLLRRTHADVTIRFLVIWWENIASTTVCSRNRIPWMSLLSQ